jgi:dihydrofolate reductase
MASGPNIGMTGSATLVSSLLGEGLLDELHLFVMPLAVGSGKRLFGTPGEKLPLKLLGSAAFPTGVVHLTYA